MFIREVTKTFRKNGKEYRYVQHRLVEAVRINNRPRQQTLLSLGTLSIPKEQHKVLANLIEAHLTGVGSNSLFDDVDDTLKGLAKHFADIIIQKRLQRAKRLLDEGEDSKEEHVPPRYETIDVHSTTTSSSRTIGAEAIALSQVRQLDFFSILQECSLTEREQNHVVAQVCARMIHPASERETARWLRSDSALDELLDTSFSQISDQTLHRITDKLVAHRDYIEQRLREVTNDLFSLNDTLVLYDLTNTYFESPKRSSAIARYGKSKEKRNDCPQITLAMIVDDMGFPKRSRILEGGVSEPDTLWDTLEMLQMQENGHGGVKTVVIDAGIATEENLAKLRADPRFEYVAISRKKKFDPELRFDSPRRLLKMKRGKELEVTTTRRGDEVFMLCKSPDRAHKDEAIHARRRSRFEQALTQLDEKLRWRKRKQRASIVYERLGRLKERHKVGPFYDIAVNEQDGKASGISWQYKAEKAEEPGQYIIRTSRTDLSDEQISRVHRTLTMIESAFRWLKSDLGLRPNFHQQDKRVIGHATISVLAYFILAPILNKLEWGGAFVSSCGKSEDHTPWNKPYGWKAVVRTMSSQTRVTTSFDCSGGGRMDVRTTLQPTREQLGIYHRLQVNPHPLKRVIAKNEENVVPKKQG